eukprot:m.132058 g.132058  ORF g.132058 m.132058 type:complete len:117 (+) comp38061_c0_seq20:2492-2842(+)
MALCQGDLLPLHLARPVIKRILQIPLKHPDDMKSVDHLLYESTVEYLLSTSIDSLDLGLAFTFTQTLPNGGNPIEIELEKEGNSKVVTDENKVFILSNLYTRFMAYFLAFLRSLNF